MEVKLPNLGEGAESGTVVSVLVKSGDTVEKDQTLIEIENEKAVAPIPAPAAGNVGEVRISEGDSVSVGQVILILQDGADAGASASSSATDDGQKASSGQPKSQAPVPQNPGGAGASSPTGFPRFANPGMGFGFAPPAAPATGLSNLPGLHEIWIPGAVVHSPDSSAAQAGFSPPASPTVRRMAAELGIDLAKVPGSGSGGRIQTADLKAYISALHQAVEVLMGHVQAMSAAPAAASAAPEKPKPKSIDFTQWGEVKKEALSSLRKTISRRMSEHWNTIPHVTQFDSVDVTDLNALRKKLAPAYKDKGARLTMTPFVMKALVQALDAHPVFASSLDEATQELVYKQYRHVGIAVDTEAGLVVPVIRDVDQKSLLELSEELGSLADKAKERKLSGDDMSGGVITISNQGAIGGAHFTPIVNKPEVAIVGLGRGAMQPAVVGDKILPRLMMPVTLSYDHRVIDGGTAARFMVDFVEAFQSFNEENSAV